MIRVVCAANTNCLGRGKEIFLKIICFFVCDQTDNELAEQIKG